ncbi:unnamed protein product [Linum trigynum]|uniref:Uncharacterized protein n=1 Tax=Linum trigynum TaxID=586398 RepID=A0AAV2G9R6_9ROSI
MDGGASGFRSYGGAVLDRLDYMVIGLDLKSMTLKQVICKDMVHCSPRHKITVHSILIGPWSAAGPACLFLLDACFSLSLAVLSSVVAVSVALPSAEP